MPEGDTESIMLPSPCPAIPETSPTARQDGGSSTIAQRVRGPPPLVPHLLRPGPPQGPGERLYISGVALADMLQIVVSEQKTKILKNQYLLTPWQEIWMEVYSFLEEQETV